MTLRPNAAGFSGHEVSAAAPSVDGDPIQEDTTMRIAVTTPAGNVGHYLTRILIRGGIRPLLVTRHPENLPAGVREHADVAAADVRYAEQTTAALTGVDALYWVDPPSAAEDPLADYDRATAALVEAVRRNGISRVVLQSSVGAEKRHGVGEIDGLAATETALDALVDELGLDVAHLRCGYFATNLAMQAEAVRTGRLTTVLPLDLAQPWVAPRDIAEVAATILLDPSWHGRRVQAVHGPEDLSWAQVARILTGELEREVTAERVSDGDMLGALRAMGMTPEQADAMLGMSTGLRDGFEPEQPRSIVTTTPTTLRTWVREELAPMMDATG